ncbi:hypothetical protein FBEOM_11772 [Fusarium beomiforme]|uniref:Uncharacterized protein n=1 Tax=Fusarium beomiforme TaxID=44412 RepID=A0A9P5A8T3_9HYPO|nr:hypothetical protein FBEOM_11772 [Fusarium beomiforme]
MRYRQLNKCKTKKKDKKLCPIKEPSKMCDMMTYVSEYNITTKLVPTGLKVLTKQVDLCETVPKFLGQSEGDKFIKSSEAICKCFPRLQQLSLPVQTKSISQGVISKANAKVADEIPGLETCLQEGGLSIENGWSDATLLIQAQRSAIVAFEIVGAVQKVFANFILNIEGGFRSILNSWGVLTSMNFSSVELRDIQSNLMSYMALAQAQVDSINDSCEKLDSCKGTAVSSFMEQVTSHIAATTYLGKLRFPAELAGKLNPLLQQQANASNQARDLLDEATTMVLFKSGNIKNIKDLFQFLPIIKRVKDLSNDIKTQLDPFKEFFPNNLTFAISTATEENKLRLMNFDKIGQELAVDEKEENREVLDKLNAMKELISKNDDSNYLTRVTSSIGSIQGQLSYLSSTNGKFIIEIDIITFKQWSKLPTMAMPCSKNVDKIYKYSGVKEVFSYPEYSKCMDDGMTAAFPDRQIETISFLNLDADAVEAEQSLNFWEGIQSPCATPPSVNAPWTLPRHDQSVTQVVKYVSLNMSIQISDQQRN